MKTVRLGIPACMLLLAFGCGDETPPAGGLDGSSGSGGSSGAGSGAAGRLAIAGATGNVAGAGSTCGLPLEAGPCEALVRVFGFDAQSGHCVEFTYGGCEGNENRYETLADCEAACGGSNLAGCPEDIPSSGSACMRLNHSCSYTANGGCLCAYYDQQPSCDPIDQSCTAFRRRDASDGDACTGDACVARIVAASWTLCQCTTGVWSCP